MCSLESTQECVCVGISHLCVCGSLLAFFTLVSDLVQLCPCPVTNIMPLCSGCEHWPFLGFQVQKVSAQHYFPVRDC